MNYKGFYTAADDRIDILRRKFKDAGVPVIADEGLSALCFFVRLKQPLSILEIGSAAGLSGAAMLLSCGGRLTGLEKDGGLSQKARENLSALGLEGRAEILTVDAAEYLKDCQKSFDFIFLDSAKSKYKDYLPRLCELLDNGGVLFCDNVLYKGLVEKDGIPARKQRTIVNNLRIFLQMLKSEPALETAVFQIGDGISVSVKSARDNKGNEQN